MQRFFLSLLLVMIAFSSCNDGAKPPRRVKAKSSDATPDGTDQVQAYLSAKMSWVEAPHEVYVNHLVDIHLGTSSASDSGKMTVVLDFVGAKSTAKGDVASLVANSGCSGMTETASKFSSDAQQEVLTRISEAYADTNFLMNEFPAISKGRRIVITIGGTSADAGCPATVGAGVALTNYANLITTQRAMLFDPPAETPETIERLAHHIEQIMLVGTGELDLADDFAGYTGGEVIEPISGEVTSVLLGLARGVDALKPAQVANVSALAQELEALVTSRAVPLAGIDRAITVVAFASSTDSGGQQISIADAADALSKAANSPAADALSVIAMAAGHPEIALGLEIVKALVGDKGASGSTSQSPTAVSMPRFDELLQLKLSSGAESAVTLVEKYKQLKDHIESHYTGGPQAALRAAALVGYAQAISGN